MLIIEGRRGWWGGQMLSNTMQSSPTDGVRLHKWSARVFPIMLCDQTQRLKSWLITHDK